jgi:hypothetical protein
MTERGAHGSGSATAAGAPPVPGWDAPWRATWTPAHSAAAVFLGECVAVGAVLGFLTELARLVAEGDARPAPHGRRGLTRTG